MYLAPIGTMCTGFYMSSNDQYRINRGEFIACCRRHLTHLHGSTMVMMSFRDTQTHRDSEFTQRVMSLPGATVIDVSRRPGRDSHSTASPLKVVIIPTDSVIELYDTLTNEKESS